MATLKDLLASGMSRDEINALLSQGTVGTEGFQAQGFMGGEPYMPPPQAEPQQPPRFAVGEDGLSRMTDRPGEVEQAPMNTIRNNSTGVVTQMPSSGRRSHDVWADGPQEIGRKQLADGTTEIIRKIPVMRDGRQSVGMERLIETPDYLNPVKFKQLEYQKREAEVRNLNAPPESAYGKELAKRLAEADAAKLMAKTPGTPEYERVQKQATEKENEGSRRDNAVTSAIGVLENINNARGKINWASTGIIGQGLRNFGGTDALSLNEALEPVRASLSFDRLQRMRDESKTGGALGQVAVQELDMLQKSMASLNTAQNEADLNRSLDVVQKHYSNYVSAMQKARANGEFSGSSPAKSNAQIEGERQFAQAKGIPPEGAVRRIR